MWGGWSSSDEEEDEEEIQETKGKKEEGVPTDYANEFDDFEDDVLGDDSDDEDDMYSYRSKKKKKKKDAEQESAYMAFDFRRGPTQWPDGVELIDAHKASELLEKAKEAAAAEAKRLQEREAMKDKEEKDGGGKKKGKKDKSDSAAAGGMAAIDEFDSEPWWMRDAPKAAKGDDSPVAKDTNAPEGAKFETLNDGSTALIVEPGMRLKLDLANILEGGDAKKEEREKEEIRKKKRAAKMWGGFSGFGGGGYKDFDWKAYWKEWVNEYTVIMDVKLKEEPAREGVALFQTALVHSSEAEGGSKGGGRLKQSEGEAIISSAGGLGVLGSFGDVTKARVQANRWHRVQISVRCSPEAKQKGEMLTWVDANTGAVLKSDAIQANGRFALDPANLFLFSSSQPLMMHRTVHVRTVRVIAGPSTEMDAKQDLALDRVLSMFNLEREKEIDAQRRGLSLSSLFAKPRPVWTAPAVVGTFGDPFIEGTIFEGSSCLSWSFEVLNFAFKRMMEDQDKIFASAGAELTRNALGDVSHILQRSAPIFKDMVRLLKIRRNTQLMSFLRKLRNHLSDLPEGETLMLPALVEGRELLMLLERTSERSYSLAVINTDPRGGLQFHSSSPAVTPNKIMFRTSLVLGGIPKKHALDDVFWMAVYNLCLRSQPGDTHKFYDVLLPFMTNKPLEVSLVEGENAADNPDNSRFSGPWRTPQRAATTYVRCFFQAFNFILTRRRGVSPLRAKQVGLALRLQMVEMIHNDLKYMHPDGNGQRVCAMALRQLSYRAVKMAETLSRQPDDVATATKDLGVMSCLICLDDIDDGSAVSTLPCGHKFHKECLDELVASGSTSCPACRDDVSGSGSIEQTLDKVRGLVDQCKAELSMAEENDLPLPAKLDLSLSKDWLSHPLAWDVEQAPPDPGQALALKKLMPFNMLQIPRKVYAREEAVHALRTCDKLCTLINNQDHCIKNGQFLIASLIEHVFVHVVPVPKPRDTRKDGTAERRAARCERRRAKAEAKVKAMHEKRREAFKAKMAAKKGKKDGDKGDKEDKDKEVENRVKEELDLEPGREALERALQEECVWDEDITYELQVELLLVLQRLMEHFLAAVMSIEPTRSFDCVRIVVPGVMSAIADSLLRRPATNHPSEACAQLSGMDSGGRQLGLRGFGIGVGPFAKQSETMEVHTPEIAVARAAILDYFESPMQKKLDKIFHWEENFNLHPGRALIKWLRMVSREVAYTIANPHLLMVDNCPESSLLLKNFPEIRAYRDIAFYWKYLLNPDAKAFANSGPRQPKFSRMQAVLAWTWNAEEKGYRVDADIMQGMRCVPDPNRISDDGRQLKADELPAHRYPSTATPSFFVPPPPLRTEDDAIYRANLPTFDDEERTDKGGKASSMLNQRDSELLISFLTVPYIRVPLVLNFFASEDRVHKLASAKLRLILDSVLFEPGKHLPLTAMQVEPKVVPTTVSSLLGCAYGLLLNELYRSPECICSGVLSLLDSALALDTGSVCDDASNDFNSSVVIILYVVRLANRVLNYIHYVVARLNHDDKLVDTPVREHPPDPSAVKALEEAQVRLSEKLCGPITLLLDDYLSRLHEETEEDPEDENLINRNARLACDLHAHRLLALRTLGAPGAKPLDEGTATSLVGSFVYLTARHTWNKRMRDAGQLLLPETELYELLSCQRRRLVRLADGLKQLPLDAMMQTALQVATSTTGTLGASTELIDASNRWGKLQGFRSVGRFGIASSRTGAGDGTEDAPTYVENAVEVGDTGLLGVEMDLQLGQMTLRSKHLAALESDIANLPDVRMVLGDSTMQASLLERSQYRRRYRLVGVRHEVEFWPDGHGSCPPLSDLWERDYDPAELFDSERWLPPLFEPVRKSFFDGPSPPPMHFMMAAGPLPDNAEVAVLLGLHQKLGGPFKLVYLFRQYRCVHVYECVSHARRWWYSLHFTTENRYCLRELQPSYDPRFNPPPSWFVNGAGAPYPKQLGEKLWSCVDPSQEGSTSVAIIRDAAHQSNLSGGRETLVPPYLLHGLLPQAILETHYFWQDETPPGRLNFRRMRGYPKDEEQEHHLLTVEVFGSDTSAITGRPERVVRCERMLLSVARRDFEKVSAVAGKLEAMELVCAPPKRKREEEEDSEVQKKKVTKTFMEDDKIETLASDLVTGMADEVWVPAKVLSCNADGTYDLEYLAEWSWVGTVRNVEASNVREKKAEVKGKGVWVFEGLSDSEEDAWRSDDSEEDEQEATTEGEERKKATVSPEQFNAMAEVMGVCVWTVEVAEEALNKVKAKGLGPFWDMSVLANEMRKVVDVSKAEEKKDDAERMLLLDLMYAPRRSTLHSLAKTLCNVETLAHICVWTKDVERQSKDGYTIDAVELPRLKLTFTARRDHNGTERLFSVDHADLFISNDHSALSARMVGGIPNFLLLSNIRGEMQLLVPVLPPHRPRITTQPFTTRLVMDRQNLDWIGALSQRFYLYPIHVSLSFVLTKGLNSALYLLLLRLLHRDYDEAYRLTDSIATDSKLSAEGVYIFAAFAYASDDCHPDAHAVRLKVSLVTIDSGTPPPWDLTKTLSEYTRKLSHVSATCRLPLQEELQLLECDGVVLDEQSPHYNPDVHDAFTLAIVNNRLHLLRATIETGGSVGSAGDDSNSVTVSCFASARTQSSGWPWYQDNTVFGEQYNQAVDVASAEEWEKVMEVDDHLRRELVPPGGWLTCVCFHVLWSSGSVQLMPRIADLVPMHPWVTFVHAKADCRGMDKIAKQFQVEDFPTLILLRGGEEVTRGRVKGAVRGIERLLHVLTEHVTEADKSAYAQLLFRQKQEAGEEEQEEAEDEGEVTWVWDVETCGQQVRVADLGLTANLREESDTYEEKLVWEYKTDWRWDPMPKDIQDELERRFLKGFFFKNSVVRLREPRFTRGLELTWNHEDLQINNDMLENLEGYWTNDDEDCEVRRRGPRVKLKGEEKFLTRTQKQLDAQMTKWREQQAEFALSQRKERFGKSVEAIRGTVGFSPGAGSHRWTLRWEHEPKLGGKGDGVGVCTSHSEVADACEPPSLGGAYDEGASLALYANGELFHKGKLVATLARSELRVLVEDDLGLNFVLEGKDEGDKKKDDGDKDAGKADEKAEEKTEEPAKDAEEEGGKKEGEDEIEQEPVKEIKYARAEEGYAALWGKGSQVTCVLDTDNGGQLTFVVDEEELYKVEGVFALLGGQELFPTICMSPLDDPYEEEQKKQEKEEAAAKKTGDVESETSETEGSKTEEGDAEEEDDEDEEEEGDDVPMQIKQLAKDTKLSIQLITSLSEDERRVLAHRVQNMQEYMNTARVTIIAPVQVDLEIEAAGAAEKEEKEEKEGEETAEEERKEEGKTKEKNVVAEEAAQPIERIRWLHETQNGWEVYSVEISRELETARRAGKAEHTLRIGEDTYICRIKVDGGEPTQECNDETQRLRRHFMKEGLMGQWEMMSVKYQPPMSLYGEGALKMFQNVWAGNENYMGRQLGLGFLLVYSLLQGQKRCKLVTSGGGDWWKDWGGYGGGVGFGGGYGGKKSKGGASSSDSHRLGLLLAQLYTDRHTKSVWSSIINVMGRNKQLCVRMPEFRDTRKSKQSHIYNGWTDELEPRSPLSELFAKLVPLMQGLKRSRQGSFVFPPKPPHPELPLPPTEWRVRTDGRDQCFRPEVRDFGCSEQRLRAISATEINTLAAAVKCQLFATKISGEPPVELEDEIHLEELTATHKNKLFIIDFHAEWCGPCRSFAPLFRRLALDTPSAKFLRANVDSCDRLASRFGIKALPTIKFIRGGVTKEAELASIEGLEENFMATFMDNLTSLSTPEELALFERRGQLSEDSAKRSEEIAQAIAADFETVTTLCSRPLAAIADFVTESSRLQRGLNPVEPKLAFDVSTHDAARTAVAKSMLSRMRDDVTAFASAANHQPSPKLSFLSDEEVRAHFEGDTAATGKVEAAVQSVEVLVQKLEKIREEDATAVRGAISLIMCTANHIDAGAGGAHGRRERTEFVLRRTAGQAAEAWPEFLFGSVLSTEGVQDVEGLNPYMKAERAAMILQLVCLTMLRANRLGHVNRCIGATVSVMKLLKQSIAEPTKGETLVPKVIQAGDDLAGMLAGRRHFGTAEADVVRFDPRFLMFEFVWNLLLRRKQIDIVHKFVEIVRAGGSKVKQMIMGAGKTTVVAPLMTLMLANGSSLVLSVVPKALLEMSRTQMRETFANIMTKRVYTLKFERSTTVRPQMRLALENAARNRGVVVATPTTLKSIMLVYIESLRNLDVLNQGARVRAAQREEAEKLANQARELAGIIKLFHNGVMLLDEVDLLLHPLKSELNFPLGEKFDLDCSESGERWTLPIHLLDAVFYTSTGRASAFEDRGMAVEILKRISAVLSAGFASKALQRLPHVTLLNLEWYHANLKPLMAEWVYLWLQKQHLHGISRQEATTYMLEGAVARSEATGKVAAIEAAQDKTEAELGLRLPISPAPLTDSHMASLPDQQRFLLEEENMKIQAFHSSSMEEDPNKKALLQAEHKELQEAKEAGLKQAQLFQNLYDLDEQLDRAAHESASRISKLQQKMVIVNKLIQEVETPRDDSFDNMTVLWASTVFAQLNQPDLHKQTEESEVYAACGKLEEMGFTVRRCGTYEEAVERAAQLQASGHLRCVVAGGEATITCLPGCTMTHDGNCMVCNRHWRNHSGHRCPDGRTGKWLIKGKNKDVKPIDCFRLLHTLAEEKQGEGEPVPQNRLALYAGISSLKEDKRLSLWQLGVTITDDKDQLQEWVEAQLPWPGAGEGGKEKPVLDDAEHDGADDDDNDDNDEEDDEAPPPLLHREASSGIQTLKMLRQRLQRLESLKEAAQEAEEAVRSQLRAVVVAKHQELETDIDARLQVLATALTIPNAALLPLPDVCGIVGPTSGRDAAIAIGWLKVHADQIKGQSVDDAELAVELRWAVAAVRAEHKWLSQAALAAKVLAHVTAPLHKKLLNLCHDWLRTFLPHVLAKINRVSFGLLSEEDCFAALEEDPNVPRSRLKLAVPFIGKDVPSKSSEFAHPDIIIGLTILAYRYTGMRYEDFVELVDALRTEFSLEIGPARDRPSSKRHEQWVLTSGGKIRGLNKDKAKEQDGKIVVGARCKAKYYSDGAQYAGEVKQKTETGWAVVFDGFEEHGSQDTLSSDIQVLGGALEGKDSAIEVVQLKFLQKSNDEQMEKLYRLWQREPLAIHYYLCKFIFPAHMRSQKLKISASGQAVGGDMLVGRRIGFSGTPSDLLPKELGKCDYETGDDGKMLSTVLDPSVATHELLSDDWTVQSILERIAQSTNPRYHALIDTGALITGYSNLEVAQYLLDKGLEWCDGVVFLDENDEKQVLVRATGRAVWADQCGVPLERRFAFYDQIHTTGMDIKHVVNATAVITLGKDMVFRDYVQGAYRMRGIGAGQRVHIYIIPEVADLMRRELAACKADAAVVNGGGSDAERMLLQVVAWLVINSMLSEQTQWSMLCLQNVSNIYRKNAFMRILQGVEEFAKGNANDAVAETQGVLKLPLRRALQTFDEKIDFSLEATVPDPIPFEKKLRDLLEEHHDLIISEEQHEVGHRLLIEVEELSIVGDNANRLDTEQEREQEQEQQKEVKTKREQQIEVEKFVEREYSRHQERPVPWPVSMLALDPQGVNADQADQHPFYPLRDFRLLNQESLCFPSSMLVSRNYFNPAWSGLRRIKNVVVVVEWSPDTSSERLRLVTPEEHEAVCKLDVLQEAAVKKVHTLLAFHKGVGDGLSKEGLEEVVLAATDRKVPDDELDRLMAEFGEGDGEGRCVTAAGMRRLLTSGRLRPESKGRYWVAVSLAEAETLRRVLHVRMAKEVLSGRRVELAMHMSMQGQEIGKVLDASSGWRERSSGASQHETAVTHGCFRYFDGDMHYLPPTLTKMVRVLQAAHPHDRELFFNSTVAARRRIDRKWQETPLSTLFTISDEWMALKQRAQAAFVRQAIKAKGLSPWEAFVAFDADNNSRLAPAELYGALRWLEVPELTSDDVVDFFELADHNRDGMIEYSEYMMLMQPPQLADAGTHLNPDDDDDDNDEERGMKEPPAKIEPYGGDELREIVVRRRRAELERQKEEHARRTAQQLELDLKTYSQELQASAERAGGSNPKMLLVGRDDAELSKYGKVHGSCRLTEFSFYANQHPLRTFQSGKCKYVPILIGEVRKKLQPLKCKSGHDMKHVEHWHTRCTLCKRYGPIQQRCDLSWQCRRYACARCVRAHEDEQVKERSDPVGKQTMIVCEPGCELTLHVPPMAIVDPSHPLGHTPSQFAVTLEVKLVSLPPKGQLAAMLRFAPGDIAHARRLHRASVYLEEGGRLQSADRAVGRGGKAVKEALECQDVEQTAVGAGRWVVVTVTVDSKAGKMQTYVDGCLASKEDGVDVRDLQLGQRIIILGGGKAAQTRGGSVRRVLVHDGWVDEADAKATYVECVNGNQAVTGKLRRVQAIWRARRTRKALEEEGVMKRLKETRKK